MTLWGKRWQKKCLQLWRINHKKNWVVSADAASCPFFFWQRVVALGTNCGSGCDRPPRINLGNSPRTLQINYCLDYDRNVFEEKVARERRVTPLCRLIRPTPWAGRWAWTGLGNCTSYRKKFYLYRIQNEDLFTENLFVPGLRQV